MSYFNFKANKLIKLSLFFLLLNPFYINAAEFSGDLKLSCEALLCLSSGSPPGECNPSLNRYYSIDYDDFGDTLRERIKFLNICPVSGQTPQMKSLVNAIAHGAGRCDAASLNVVLREWIPTGNTSGMYGNGYFCIKDQLPTYCSAYLNHEYTDLNASVKYVIDPPQRQFNPFGSLYPFSLKEKKTCGHWVDQ